MLCWVSLLLRSFNTINQAGSFFVSVSLALYFALGVENNSRALSKGGDFNGVLCGLVLDSLSICVVLLCKLGDSVCNHGHQYLCSAIGSKCCFS